jgi:hypothetical protein
MGNFGTVQPLEILAVCGRMGIEMARNLGAV